MNIYRGVGLLLLLVLAGCGTIKSTSKQLERVAKDWCLTIRASQVIPVYPLTEDLQPGDVFLVQTTKEDEVDAYKKKGFLPFEHLMARIPPDNYQKFYAGGYGLGSKTLPPRHWQFSDDPNTKASYATAPHAAFPTYSFSVSKSAGLSLAVPVQGVPIGLNLLGGSSAHGTISIRKAYTYGTDTIHLFEKVREWAQSNREHLAPYARIKEDKVKKISARQYYLRVVNRVYLAQEMDVSLFNKAAGGGQLSGGAPQPVSLLNLGPEGSQFKDNLDKANEFINGSTNTVSEGNEVVANALPANTGGSVKLTMASSRSVSLKETFARPLVIGYIGFDIPIDEDGDLEAPVSTQDRLEGKEVILRPLVWEEDANSIKLTEWLDEGKQNREAFKAWLGQFQLNIAIADVVTGKKYAYLRQKAVDEFINTKP